MSLIPETAEDWVVLIASLFIIALMGVLVATVVIPEHKRRLEQRTAVTEITCGTQVDTAYGRIESWGLITNTRRYKTTDGRIVTVTGPCRMERIR